MSDQLLASEPALATLPAAEDYDADSIKKLSDREHVRLRRKHGPARALARDETLERLEVRLLELGSELAGPGRGKSEWGGHRGPKLASVRDSGGARP